MECATPPAQPADPRLGDSHYSHRECCLIRYLKPCIALYSIGLEGAPPIILVADFVHLQTIENTCTTIWTVEMFQSSFFGGTGVKVFVRTELACSLSSLREGGDLANNSSCHPVLDLQGVVYSHRSNFLQAIMEAQPDCMNSSCNSIFLPIVPM